VVLTFIYSSSNFFLYLCLSLSLLHTEFSRSNNTSCMRATNPLHTHTHSLKSTYSETVSNASINVVLGWGTTRYEAGRPVSLPPPGAVQHQHDLSPALSMQSRISAESSSESEASGIIHKKDNKEKDRKGVFRIFSKKKSKNQS
jgi:hypothetical protein